MERFTARLDTIGADGWEMISYESIPMVGGITGQQKGHIYLMFFKRPVEG